MTNYLDDIRYNGKVQAVILDWAAQLQMPTL